MCNPFDGSQLCAQVDPDLFFPEHRKEWKSNVAEAKALCAQCPMLAACSKYATETVGLYGVWAGKWHDGSGYVSPAPYSTTNRKVA
jgi:hypothetical protein